MNLEQTLKKLRQKQNLTQQESFDSFQNIFSDTVSDDQIKEFLILLYEKGETVEEILGAVKFLRSQGKKAICKSKDLIDCCGTGGDQKNTFNISTAVAFVLAGAGCHVAKHGNKAVSSQSGSADVLTELGINIQASPEVMAKCIDDIGIGFLFAPSFYPLLKKVGPIRKSIPHRTVFNILGPLLNPANAKKQLIGVFSKDLVLPIAQVLQGLDCESAVVVHSHDGMDELSLSGLNSIATLQKQKIESHIFDPKVSGYDYCQMSDLQGGTPTENAKRFILTLKGHSEPLDHVVHINAAWGLVAAGKANSFLDGLLLAQQSISSGKAYQKLQDLIQITKN